MNRHSGALILITVIDLAGCTYTDSAREPPQPRTSGSAATIASPNSVPRTVEGNTPAIGSVVIYDYQARLAYGAANLK